MSTYDLGDGVPLEFRAYTRDGVLTATTVALTVTRPDGTTVTPDISSTTTGIYRATPEADQVGLWSGAWTASGTVTNVATFSFLVTAAAASQYVDLVSVKAALGKLTSDDRDELILQAISSASRWIDRRTGRRFYADQTATARIFRTAGARWDSGDQVLAVDDIADATGVTVAVGTTGSYTAVAAFELGPFNAAAYGLPYREIRVAAGWLPSCARVQVTARWGWPAVPDEIVQAAQLLATRLYRRKDSPQGVLGSSEWGPTRVSRSDPDVEALIGPFTPLLIA